MVQNQDKYGIYVFLLEPFAIHCYIYMYVTKDDCHSFFYVLGFQQLPLNAGEQCMKMEL